MRSELMAGFGHALEIVARLRAQGVAVLLEEELAVAEDRVHRRAQLVPHVRDERFDHGHASQSCRGQQGVDLGEQPGEVDGLRVVVLAARLDRAEPVGFHRVRRQRDDGNRRGRRVGA